MSIKMSSHVTGVRDRGVGKQNDLRNSLKIWKLKWVPDKIAEIWGRHLLMPVIVEIWRPLPQLPGISFQGSGIASINLILNSQFLITFFREVPW